LEQEGVPDCDRVQLVTSMQAKAAALGALVAPHQELARPSAAAMLVY
jgi:hypothetical protein